MKSFKIIESIEVDDIKILVYENFKTGAFALVVGVEGVERITHHSTRNSVADQVEKALAA